MVVPLPLGADPVRRLVLIAAETAERKRKVHPQTGSGISIGRCSSVRGCVALAISGS